MTIGTDERLTNWAGNQTYDAARLHRPTHVADVQEIVASASTVKALGTRHSFNRVADTTGDLISLARLERIMRIDRERRTITVDGGATYGQIGPYLHAEGYALHNLASLPHISVAGACATATHGSGDRNGGLATAVFAMDIVTASGDIRHVSRELDGDRFEGMVVHLGALGVVTAITLGIQPTFDVRQDVYEALPLPRLDDSFDAISSSAYSVSLFTDWSQARIDQVWVKSRVDAGEPRSTATNVFEALPATQRRHPIGGISAEHCTEQLGVPGAWHDRLPHFRLDFTPSNGAELQTDYLVPRELARDAFRAVAALRAEISPLLLVSEVRTVAADDLWMSPFYERDCVSLHFTWKPDWVGVQRVLPMLEAALAPIDARPHWGKLFTMDPTRVRALYPRLDDFRALVAELDPLGKFRNAFLDRYVFV